MVEPVEPTKRASDRCHAAVSEFFDKNELRVCADVCRQVVFATSELSAVFVSHLL
jgi:hypothetical protein